MTNRVGVYWCPGHGRPGDLDYMRRLQPRAIRILDPDVQHISDAHKAAPNALILPRDWALSEQKSDANHNPVGTGERHAHEWRTKINAWRDQANQRGIPFPTDQQIVVVGINEPNEGVLVNSQVVYTMTLCDEARRLGLMVSALNLGVGWPANTGPDTPPDWEPYRPALDAIVRGGHFLTLHSYWYDDPANGWGWLAGRHTKVPSWFTGRMIVGECGIDRYVDAARWQNEGGNRGWRGNIGAEQYAGQLVNYAARCDPRVVAVLPFLTDYRSREWESFDTAEAHPHILAHAASAPDNTVHVPVVVVDTPAGDDFRRAVEWVLRWEGEGPVIDSNGAWTKWGINQAANPQVDVRNLTREQAIEIYRQGYWLASGADKLSWPLCLVHFNAAVNAGVYRAGEFLKAANNAPDYIANQLDWYTRIDGWQQYGGAWTRRMADLVREL